MYRSASEPMSSGRFREAILVEHDTLRGLLAQAVGLAEIGSASVTEFDDLRASARQLYVTLEEHMSFEERTLPVALRDVIGLGSVLQARIAEDHGRQRQKLAVALGALETDTLSWRQLADDLRLFAADLLLDMEKEEECLLDADVDALSTDSEGG
jgi:hypothetical protein